MRCSVVVPTYRRPQLLERLLAALVRQDFPADAFEVLVVDDAHSDEAGAQVERWAGAGPVRIRYLRAGVPQCGPAAARNTGWRNARGEIIAFTDDDTVPEPAWLREGLAVFAGNVDAASGRVVVPLSGKPTDYELDASRLADAGFVTANCFCRRPVLEAVGGFDPRFRTAWREDSDLFFKLIGNGYEVVHADDAVVAHPVRPAPWGVSVAAEKKHRYDALLYKKHPVLYERFIRPDRPYLYYAIVSALGVAALGSVMNAPRLSMAGLASWGTLTAVFTLRRLRTTARTPARVAEIAMTSVAIPFVSIYWRVRGGLEFRVAFW